MKKNTIKTPLLIGTLAFALTFVVTLLINSPAPFWASLIVAFLIFETCFYSSIGNTTNEI